MFTSNISSASQKEIRTETFITNPFILWCSGFRHRAVLYVITKPSEKPAVCTLFCPKSGERKFLRNIDNHLPDYTVSYPRISRSKSSPPQREILTNLFLHEKNGYAGV
jgi:hypothetical protein